MHVMQWGKQQGFRLVRARHGAALRRSETSPVATFWNRLGAFMHDHGGSLLHFQGCAPTSRSSIPTGSRATWRIRGGMRLALILADVSALVAGGYRHIFRK